ncbi:MAG: hypothetical protein WBW33_02045 [Bryobacteraceae bacterium]
MVSLDTNSSVTQSLVDQLVTSATVNGAFSLTAFESELSSVVDQVLSLAASGGAQTTASTAAQSLSSANSNDSSTTTSASPAETSNSSGSSQDLVATQSQQSASSSTPKLALLSMFGGDLPPVVQPVVQSGSLLVSNLGEVSAAPAGTSSIANTPAPVIQCSEAGSYTAGTMVHSYDPFWGNLAGPLVPASGTTWTQLSTGKDLDSGAVIAGLQSRYGAGTATMQTVLYNQFGVQALNQYNAQNPSSGTTPLCFASLPPSTAFQFYGPDNSFVDPNNQNQYCYFDENGLEHLSGAAS